MFFWDYVLAKTIYKVKLDLRSKTLFEPLYLNLTIQNSQVLQDSF
jgi:hypothetical protein